MPEGIEPIVECELEEAIELLRRPEAHVTDARLSGLRIALGILALAAVVALFMAQRIPQKQPAAADEAA